MVLLLGMMTLLLEFLPVEIKYLESLIDPTPDAALLLYIPFCSLANVTFLGLEVGGLIFSLCTLFFLGTNSSSSLDSRLLRYLSMVLLIYSNYNSIAYIFFSVSSTLFIAWYFFGLVVISLWSLVSQLPVYSVTHG